MISDVFTHTKNRRSFRHIPDCPHDNMELLRKGAEILQRMQRGGPFATGEIARDRHHFQKWPFKESLPPVILSDRLVAPLAAEKMDKLFGPRRCMSG